MKIILLDTVLNLGKIGEILSVKAGYARNFLFPKRLAVPATYQNILYFNTKKLQLENNKLDLLNHSLKRTNQISVLKELKLPAKIGPGGKLFGSICARDIINALIMEGILIDKSEIILPVDSLRMSGKYEIIFNFHPNIKTKLIVNIVPEIKNFSIK
ncbi:MAG: 50S ribosomal protein L9 [Candidatus Dasytiphilus stammeri]